MVGVFGPSHGFVEFSSDRRPSRAEQSGCQPRKTLCTEICARAICRKFGGRTFLRQFFSMADLKKCRVNTGEKHGGPGRDRTDDLFHAMEARSQLRHRPTRGEKRIIQFSRRQAGSSINLQNWNISRRSPEMLLRGFKLAKPQFHWINLKMET